MKYGKLTQTAWQRSVRRQLHIEEQNLLLPPSPFETCSGIAYGEQCFLWADAHVSGTNPQTGYYAVLHAAGELAAKGVFPKGISVRVLFPPQAREEDLKAVTAEIVSACDRLGITVNSFQGETASSVVAMTVFVTAVGEAVTRRLIPAEKRDVKSASDAALHPETYGLEGGGAEILLCGYAGLEGTLRILAEAENELETRFVSAFLTETKVLVKDLVSPAQILSLLKSITPGAEDTFKPELPRVTAIRQITGGGILAALWELSESLGTGFEIDMPAVLLKQETVEICEFYRLNPYQMTSAGSFLIVTEDAQVVMDILEQAGARAVRLGVTKAQNARVITSGEEVRYLDRPAPDELAVWMADRMRQMTDH